MNKLNGLFTEPSLINMLEGVDYEEWIQYLQFLDVYRTAFCWLRDYAPITSTYIKCIALVYFQYQCERAIGWSKRQLEMICVANSQIKYLEAGNVETTRRDLLELMSFSF